MHPVDALPPITVRCTDYNELVFAMGFASDKKTARFLEQRCGCFDAHICKE